MTERVVELGEVEGVVDVPGWGLVTNVEIVPLPGYVLGERPILIQLVVFQARQEDMN